MIFYIEFRNSNLILLFKSFHIEEKKNQHGVKDDKTRQIRSQPKEWFLYVGLQ
jgi:hypothetical protein